MKRILRPAENPPETAAGEDASAGQSQDARPLILLADDNHTSLAVMTDYLEMSGFRVVTACDGQEAVSQARLTRPDLVLMDTLMPVMDGLEATRQIRADPATSHIPIIALTAAALPDDRAGWLRAGANDYVSKPVSLRKLTRTLARYVDGGRVGEWESGGVGE